MVRRRGRNIDVDREAWRQGVRKNRKEGNEKNTGGRERKRLKVRKRVRRSKKKRGLGKFN